jgi:hypothetical protein
VCCRRVPPTACWRVPSAQQREGGASVLPSRATHRLLRVPRHGAAVLWAAPWSSVGLVPMLR